MEPRHHSESPPYRGEDRRRVATRKGSPWEGGWWLAAGLVLVAVVAAALLTNLQFRPPVDIAMGRTVLLTLGVILATGAGAIGIVIWRLNGDAPALWAGSAFLLYAVFDLALAQLVPLVSQRAAPFLQPQTLAAAVLLVVAVLLVYAALLPPVDTRFRPWAVMTGATVAAAAATGLFRAFPALAFVVSGDYRAEDVRTWPDIITLAWIVLAAAFLYRAYHRRRPLFAWFSLLFVCLASARAVAGLSSAQPALERVWWELLRATGLAAVWWGMVCELAWVYGETSSRLARSAFAFTTARERLESDQAAAEERAHEARSALAAIEGATRTLEHYRERLPRETQETLAAGIVEEIRRLQRLVSTPSDAQADAIVAFSVRDALNAVAELERARGTEVELVVDDGAVASGRVADVVQIVQSLLDNARRYARTPVLLAATQRDGRVLIRVSDRGPGVPAAERERIFRRGERGAASQSAAGSGLGLAIAAQLAQDQDGKLSVEPRPGGGATFVLALPAARPARTEGDDAVHVG